MTQKNFMRDKNFCHIFEAKLIFNTLSLISGQIPTINLTRKLEPGSKVQTVIPVSEPEFRLVYGTVWLTASYARSLQNSPSKLEDFVGLECKLWCIFMFCGLFFYPQVLDDMQDRVLQHSLILLTFNSHAW